MEDGKLRIPPTAVLTVSERDVQALLAAGDGDAALLYLHILRSGGVYDSERAATELHRSDREIGTTARRLCRMGLLSDGAARAPAPAPKPSRELPEFEARDIARRSMEDQRFRELVDAVQTTLGRILSSADLKKLFGIYDTLALPADVILLLVQHCKEEYQSRYGTEKNVGFAFITNEAYEWFNREILTYEQAEQWLREHERRKSMLGQLQKTLGIRERPLSPTERRYLEEWIELGFSEDAIAIAADRTVTNTGGLKWKYMNSIIQSWHANGLHTPDEIEKGDKKPAKAGRRAAATAPTRSDDKTLEQLDRLREKMKKS